MKRFPLYLLASVSGCALAIAAQAEQITFGPSAEGIVFTGVGNGLTITADKLSGPAFDTTSNGLGVFSINPIRLTTGPDVAGIFTPDPNAFEFDYSNGPDCLTEEGTVTAIQDNTPNPKFYFTATTTAVNGNPDFVAAFGPSGSADSGDWIMNSLGTTLDALEFTTGSAMATLSSGEKVSGMASVSEPAALGLLGVALVAMGLARRRKPDDADYTVATAI